MNSVADRQEHQTTNHSYHLNFHGDFRIQIPLKTILIVIVVAIILRRATTTSNYDSFQPIIRNFHSIIGTCRSYIGSIMSLFGFGAAKNEEWKNANTVYDFTVKDIDNQDVKLDKYEGKVLLIVNVASKCGFTKGNYKELNELHSKYKDQGLAILGFPCNQFGHQEPGCEVDIKEFIKKNGVEWDMFAKVDVNGDNAIPLYSWLKNKEKGTLIDAIKWNFTKFLINKEGIPVARFAPNKSPLEFEKEISAELEK